MGNHVRDAARKSSASVTLITKPTIALDVRQPEKYWRTAAYPACSVKTGRALSKNSRRSSGDELY
jgi:hypothetical protein